MAAPHRGRRAIHKFPVEVRSINDPKPGWTLVKALDLLDQGYLANHVSRVTGYNAAYLTAQLKLRDSTLNVS